MGIDRGSWLTLAAVYAVLAAPALAQTHSPWDGDWRLDAARSSPGARDAAADGYRFRVTANRISWQIPSLGEAMAGTLDGKPFPIVRRGHRVPGMTLSVRRIEPGVLAYDVARNGRVLGGGRMTLIDDNRAWVDLTHGHGARFWGSQLVYVRR